MIIHPARFRACDGRNFKHRWIKAGGGFGCPVNRRYFVYKGLHTHRFRGAHFRCREKGARFTVRGVFWRKILAH
jgi:hypothetical protein